MSKVYVHKVHGWLCVVDFEELEVEFDSSTVYCMDWPPHMEHFYEYLGDL